MGVLPIASRSKLDERRKKKCTMKSYCSDSQRHDLSEKEKLLMLCIIC